MGQTYERYIFLPENNPKVQKVAQIFQNIIKAASVSADPKLCVKVEKSEKYYSSTIGLAQFQQEGNRIVIEEKVYDSCMIWGGENAIAYLLAHEFGHYLIYQEKGIGFPHSDTLMEADADLRGNLYARIAGYNPCNQFEYVLNKLYLGTDWIEKNSPDYPKRETRLLIAKKACIKSDSLAKLFHLGNELLVLQQYETAAVVFDYLSAQFPAPEMYFNAALARIGFAFSVRNEKTYRLPLLFDTRTGVNRKPNHNNLQKWKPYLHQAIGLLSKVEKQAENPICARIYKEYASYLRYQTLPLFSEKTESEPLLQLLQAIALSQIDTTKSAQLFAQIAPIFPAEAEWNLNILQGKAQNMQVEEPLPIQVFSQEKIAHQSLADITFNAQAPEWHIHSDSLVLNQMQLSIQFTENEYSVSYILQDLQQKKTIKILQTKASYPHTTILGDVSLSQNYEEVVKNYEDIFLKERQKVVKIQQQNLQKESILQYGYSSKNGVLFWFSANNKLTKWILYDIK